MIAAAAPAVSALAGARRAVQLYPPVHPEYGEAMLELQRSVRAAAAEGEFILNLHHGHLYDDSIVIPDDTLGAHSIVQIFEGLAIESLVFDQSFTIEHAVALAEVLSSKPDPGFNVTLALSDRRVRSVTVTMLAQQAGRAAINIAREQERALFYHALSSVRAVCEQVKAGESPRLETSRKIVKELVGRLAEDSAVVLTLAAASREQEHGVGHSFNVMAYSLALGHRLGLPSEQLVSLGTAALFHDIGKSKFDESDVAQAEHARLLHPQVGADLLHAAAPDDFAPMLVAYEHHMYFSGTGYPRRASDYTAHPYSRMVMIADCFDNLANPEPGTAALTPDRALVGVLRLAGQMLDPFLTRLFANALGPFPIGCVVRLTDQSVGIVARYGGDPLHPVVRLVYDTRGLELSEPQDVSLADGTLKIVEVVSPTSLDVTIAEKL